MTHRSRWKVCGPEQAVLERAFHETDGFPTITDRSSLACLLESSQRRVTVWFQNQRQRRKYAEDTETIASLGLNRILLLCMYTRTNPDMPYDTMARHVSDVLAAAGDEEDEVVRLTLNTFLVHEARQLLSTGVDADDAVHVATAGLLARVAGVLGTSPP